jgi:hypothetical protein
MAGMVTLAIIIGQRMSTDAMAVMVGVVFGVAASIPTSLLIVLATRGSRRHDDPPYRRADYQPTPPPPQIYVVNPGQIPGQAGQQQIAAPQQHTFDMSLPTRRWVVVGDEDAEEEYYA